MKNKVKNILLLIAGIVLGFAIGSYLVADIQPRSYLSIKECNECLKANEITGLMAAIGITKVSNFIPNIIKETDKTIVIFHPFPQANIHWVILPKKDIKDIADITAEDQEYINDAISVVGNLVREYKLDDYRLYTNGSGYQTVRYLHFHLLAK